MKRRVTDGRTDGRTKGRCERLGLSLCAVPSFNGTVVSFDLEGIGSAERDLEGFRERWELERSAERRNDGI